MPKFNLSTRIENGIRTHYIEWGSDPLDKRLFNLLCGDLELSRDYRLLTSDNDLGSRRGVGITQFASLRNIFVKSKIIKRHWVMNRVIKRAAFKYTRGVNILALSGNYDLPPLNLLRNILLYNGYPPGVLHTVFTGRVSPKSYLTNYDLNQFYIAEQNDAESIENQRNVAEVAAAREDEFVSFLRGLGIGIKTQNELAAEQICDLGRPTLTPDVLFTEPVYINNEKIAWIDFKDYLGTTISFIFDSNVKQAAKYANRWGKGGICYGLGYVQGMDIPGAILLDGRATNRSSA